MLRKSCFVLVFLFLLIKVSAQEACKETQQEVFKIIANVYALAAYGYEHSDPVALWSASRILNKYPIRTLKENKFISGDTLSDGFNKTVLDPYKLLEDALKFCKDESISSLIENEKAYLDDTELKDRGRQYSPYVQEYLLKPLGNITLNTTFLGKEIAEVYVVNYDGTALELKIFNNKGKMIAKDPNSIANCYVSFTPEKTAGYKIEIQNNSRQKTQCLLMTN
ncbi:MAG: hypothetical protein PHR81_08170 [Bacteroidales bacterium]|jgi:hypothetical protein|nr:hypothetical protein [Bacteroidales bacterium]MDD4214769.1 hypothetical protein [Bacteroidales bacterium]